LYFSPQFSEADALLSTHHMSALLAMASLDSVTSGPSTPMATHTFYQLRVVSMLAREISLEHTDLISKRSYLQGGGKERSEGLLPGAQVPVNAAWKALTATSTATNGAQTRGPLTPQVIVKRMQAPLSQDTRDRARSVSPAMMSPAPQHPSTFRPIRYGSYY
jgi:hypothetical protein